MRKKDLIIPGITLVIVYCLLLFHGNACASYKKQCFVSPIPTVEIVSPSPTLIPSITVSCTPTPLIISPTSIQVTPTDMPAPTATGTPQAGQSATIAFPTNAPDTGRVE